tara:strand:- start:880 stop:1428 length:549 start_codon:yes stop_codon:yes gene_type:complete
MLEAVSLKHSVWISMAISLGCPPYLAGDIVQEVYLRLHKYKETAESKVVKEDGSVNTFYMFGAIRNTLSSFMKKENLYISMPSWMYKDQEFEEFEIVAPEEADLEFEDRYQELMDGINKEVDSWGPYNSKLFNLYFKTDLSMRKIAGGTGIGLTHIFGSITKYRSQIKEKFSEDFDNLIETI